MVAHPTVSSSLGGGVTAAAALDPAGFGKIAANPVAALDGLRDGATVLVGETVETALRPFGGASERISAGGPVIRLGAGLTLALRLTLHELSTDALKHGALSDEHGRLAVAWDYVGGARDVFRFRWTKAGARAIRSSKMPSTAASLVFNAASIRRAAFGVAPPPTTLGTNRPCFRQRRTFSRAARWAAPTEAAADRVQAATR